MSLSPCSLQCAASKDTCLKILELLRTTGSFSTPTTGRQLQFYQSTTGSPSLKVFLFFSFLFPSLKIRNFHVCGLPCFHNRFSAHTITAVDGVHYSFMCEKGFYSCFGFLLGALFAVLGALLIYKLSASHRGTDSMNQVRFFFFFFCFCSEAFISHRAVQKRRNSAEQCSQFCL